MRRDFNELLLLVMKQVYLQKHYFLLRYFRLVRDIFVTYLVMT